MIPGIRSGHVQKIWKAMQGAGVIGISIEVKDVGVVRLTETLLIEFLCLVRGHKLDQLVGPWVRSLRDIVDIRKELAAKGREAKVAAR